MAEDSAVPPIFAEQMALLSAEYARRQGQNLAELDRRLADQGIDVPHALLQEAHDFMHRLAGSGGSFGFPDLSCQARDLERMARAWLAAPQTMNEAQWQAWKGGVRALAQTLGAGDGAPPH